MDAIAVPGAQPKRNGAPQLAPYRFRPGDHARENGAKGRQAIKEAIEAKKRLALDTIDPRLVLAREIGEIQYRIGKAKSEDKLAKLAEILLKLIRELARLQASTRAESAPAPGQSSPVNPL